MCLQVNKFHCSSSLFDMSICLCIRHLKLFYQIVNESCCAQIIAISTYQGYFLIARLSLLDCWWDLFTKFKENLFYYYSSIVIFENLCAHPRYLQPILLNIQIWSILSLTYPDKLSFSYFWIPWLSVSSTNIILEMPQSPKISPLWIMDRPMRTWNLLLLFSIPTSLHLIITIKTCDA